MSSEPWFSNIPVRNERLLHAGMVLLLAMLIALGLKFQRKVAESVASISVERQQCIELCASESEVRQAVQRLQERYESLSEDYRTYLTKIPHRVVDSEVLTSLRGIAQSKQCSLIDFRPGSMQKYPEFNIRSFDLHLEGRFKDLFGFFESLPGVPFACQIGNYKIAEPSIPGGNCRLDVELNVVFDHTWARGE